jgi:ferrochelatase
MSIFGASAPDAPRFDDAARQYDALLVLSFGGPEAKEDVVQFLQNVAGGRNIPPERLESVAEHYYHLGGASPLNGQNRALIASLEAEFRTNSLHLPIYFGNRNWHPFVTDTIRQMRADGVRRALVFVTSAYSSYSGCRQYREDIIRACETLGEGVPAFDKLRVFYNHPGFVQPIVEETQKAIAQVPAAERGSIALVFTAHSIPISMATNSDYESQLKETSRLVAERLGVTNFRFVYQSRSGPPHIPWLEPDVCDYLREAGEKGVENVVMVPIGFISDHMEVMFDLDVEARQLADKLGINLVRARTVGTHPAFVSMIRELVVERMTANPERRSLGSFGPCHDICPLNCCLNGAQHRLSPTGN